MKKILLLIPATALFVILIAASFKTARPTVSINTSALDITSANGVTMKYIIRGYEAKNLNGVEHGSCLNTTANPEIGKNGSIKSRGVSGTADPKGGQAPAGTFYCSAYTNNLKSGVKYYVKPYIKLSDGTFLYGTERSVTMK
jgi:hypothetical protein